MSFSKFIVCILLLLPLPAMSAVEFPKERAAFGPGEIYPLDQFGVWRVLCKRDAEGEDQCFVSTVVADYDNGLELTFNVNPIGVTVSAVDVDVDLAPRAIAEISPNSEAEHYARYSAAITYVDGKSFDGYWCDLKDQSVCSQHRELQVADLAKLLKGRTAVVTIFQKSEASQEQKPFTEIPVDLQGLSEALDRANNFSAAVLGYDIEADTIATEVCTFRQDGKEKRLKYSYDEDFELEQVSFRESLFGPSGGGTCPSFVTQAFLAPDATFAQLQLFCLVLDENGELVGFQHGIRDAYGGCAEQSKSFCQRVNQSKDEAIKIARYVRGAVVLTSGATKLAGVTVVKHSSGAAILTGSGGYISGTLGTIGTTTLGVLTSPVTLTATSVSVIAIGGVVYLCSD
ncbi:MAG: hypothetical protein AAF393_13755 [Pseudomonadota bacterium]